MYVANGSIFFVETQVLNAIKELVHEPEVKTFVTDFEVAIWQGIRDAFENAVIKGCAFHFSQALWRKAMDLGLKAAYNRRDGVYRLLRKVFVLPLLPGEDIPRAFQALREKNRSDDPRLDGFFSYVERTWFQNTTWEVENWSVFGRSIRTNNDVEGWHNRLNRQALKPNLPFYLLAELLLSEASEIPTQILLVKEKKLTRHQKKKTSTVQGQLMQLWEEYARKERSTHSLLEECSGLYGPVDV